MVFNMSGSCDNTEETSFILLAVPQEWPTKPMILGGLSSDKGRSHKEEPDQRLGHIGWPEVLQNQAHRLEC